MVGYMQFSAGGKVVVGVDGQEANRPALVWAVAEAKARGCPLLAVHVWHVPAMAYSVPGYMPISTDWAAEQASTMLSAAVHDFVEGGGVRIDTGVIEGSAYEELTSLAGEPDVDVVVVGSSGHGALAALFHGSVSHSLSHHCPKPLVIVPAGPPPDGATTVGHIVVGVDGSEGARRALRWAAAEAGFHRARLEVVTAWNWATPPEALPGSPHWMDAPTAAHQVITEAVADVDLSDADVKLTESEGVPHDVLLAAARSADLLVVGTRGMGRTKEILLGSTSHYCTHHSPVPVAVIPPAPTTDE